jgi:hypothetical protein
MEWRWARRGLGVLCLASAIGAGSTAAVTAAEAIGVATAVRPEVDQEVGSNSVPVKAGESVLLDEVVRTGPNGSTKIVFTDDTNLTINGSSRVALNQFVFSGKKNYEKATFQLAKGAFRFATGNSEKRAYEIDTPTATLAVRGTVFRVNVTDNGTTVDVESGEVGMCTKNVQPFSDDAQKCTSPDGQPVSRGSGGGKCKCLEITAGGSGTILLSDGSGFGGAGGGANFLLNAPQGQPPATPPQVVPGTGPCSTLSASPC